MKQIVAVFFWFVQQNESKISPTWDWGRLLYTGMGFATVHKTQLARRRDQMTQKLDQMSKHKAKSHQTVTSCHNFIISKWEEIG